MRWVIGDVHGMRAALESLLGEISKRDRSPRFLFTGDYVNRGPDSRGVIDLLLSLSGAAFVRGNHDDILDIILHGEGYCDHPTGIDAVGAFRWFMQHGLGETLLMRPSLPPAGRCPRRAASGGSRPAPRP